MMRKLRLIPDATHVRFMWLRRFTFPVTIALSMLSAVFFFTVGPNYGIDFSGGSLLEIRPLAAYDLGKIRETLNRLNPGDVQVTEVSDVTGTSVLVRVAQRPGGDTAQRAALEQIRTTFGDTIELRRVETVGPRVSGELAYKATIALAITMATIMVYVWLRFEWQFATGAIIATLHDVLMTLGFFVVTGVGFDLASIAAILTIVGYSLNDTVVVYDRVRENLRKFKKMQLSDLLDQSINETLPRTVHTSLTTLLALFALFVFGGEVIRSFVAAMIFGVVIGTYSSIYIAAPVLIYFRLRPEAALAGTLEVPPGSSAER